MHVERTEWGIVIGGKYLTAQEALDLLQWLSQQRDALLLMRQEAEVKFHHHLVPARDATTSQLQEVRHSQQEEWTPAELQEMISEDEQIVNIEL